MELREGTDVRAKLFNSMAYKESLDMIYISKSGVISKRRIEVVKIEGNTFRAYCWLRKSKRTFIIENVLALVPVIHYESMVI